MKMKTLLRLIGMTLALLLLLTAGACTMAQAEEEADEAEEAVEKEAPEGYDCKIYLDSNNHLVLLKGEEKLLDFDFECLWSGDSDRHIRSDTWVGPYLSTMMNGSEQTSLFLTQYFSEPIFMQKISYEDRTLREDHFGVSCLVHEDGEVIFEFFILKDGSVQLIDSNNNVYVSQAGLYNIK